MSRKKSPEQRANTNSKSGKAKNKHVTLDAELLDVESSEIPASIEYPMSFDNEPKRCALYDVLMVAGSKTNILKQDTDTMLIEMIVEYWFSWKELRLMLKREGKIVIELNGNTGAEIKKPHPAAKMANDEFNRLMALLKETGLTKNALARIAEKAAQIKSTNFTDDSQQDFKNGRQSQAEWQQQANNQ